MNQKLERPGVNNFVTKISPGREQCDGRNHERHGIAFFVTVEARRNKHPHLIKDERRSQEQTGERGNLQVKVERFGGIEIDQLLRQPIVSQGLHDGPLHYIVNALYPPPANAEADANGNNRVNQSFAQFLKMIEEAHGGHRLFFTIAAGCHGSELKHAIPVPPGQSRRWLG